MKLFRIIEKNFKLLCRSRKSLLIVLLIPLIMTILLGLAFNNLKPYGISIGIHVSEESNISDEIIGAFQKNAKVSFIDSESLCREKVMLGELHACIMFRQDMEMENNQKNQVDFYVDYSKINMIWMILDTISYPVSAESKEISLDLTRTLLDKLINADRVLVEQLSVIENITGDISGANAKISSSKDALSGLDLEQGESGISGLDSAISGVEQEIGNAEVYLGDIQSSLSSLESRVDSLGLDENTTREFDAAFAEISGNAASLSSTLESVSGQGMEQVRAEFEELKDGVAELEEKLSEAEAAKETVLADLNAVEETLADANTRLASLKETLTNIHLDLGSFKITNAEKIVSPINSRIIPVTVEKTHLNHIFPTLLVLIVMFTSILLSSTAVIVEKKSKAFFRNFISPVDDLLFIAARYMTDIATIGIQLAIFILISFFLLKIQIAGLPGMIIFLFLVSALFIFLGMIIGEAFSSQELSTLTTIAISSIMLFFSNTILPIESMPPVLNKIAQFNPFVIAESLLRKTIIHNLGIALLAKEIMLLVSYIIIAFIAIFIITKFRKKRW